MQLNDYTYIGLSQILSRYIARKSNDFGRLKKRKGVRPRSYCVTTWSDPEKSDTVLHGEIFAPR